MRIFGTYAWPAFLTKTSNPYNYILYNEISKQHVEVYEFTFALNHIVKALFVNNYQALHIHWPNNILFGTNIFKARIRLYCFFVFVTLIRIFGKKLIWTVHNLDTHESRFPRLQKALDAFMYKNTDGFISLNQAGIEAIRARLTKKKSQRIVHIFHPHYKGYYKNSISKMEARKALSIPAEKFVFLFLGQIRAYKNVTGLVNAYKKLQSPDALLLIAGKVHEDVRAELMDCLEGAKNIVFVDSFVKDDDLQLYFNCADAVVTPYNKIFNSGSAFLNLSFDRPTLAPNMWALSELKQIVGGRWIKTYENDISAGALETCMQEVIIESKTASLATPDISRFDPEEVARQTILFYQYLFS